MRQIHKYVLHNEPLMSLFTTSAISKVLEVVTKAGALPLDVQSQNGEIVLWVIEDPDERTVWNRRFQIAFTGAQLPDDCVVGTHVKTLQTGPMVLHVFDITPHSPDCPLAQP